MKKWSSQWTKLMQIRKEASLRNCINCVHCDDHYFIFISFPQLIYNLFHISLTIQDHAQNVEEQLWMGGRREVSIISHGPVISSDLKLERDLGTLVKRNKNQLCDYNRGSPVSWDASIVMLGSRVEIFQVITLPGQPVEWTKGETGQRVTHCFQSLY